MPDFARRALRRFYDGIVVDTLVPDLVVEDRVIVDPKVAESFTPTHTAQMIGYLSITGLQLALLVNFKFADLRWNRVVRQSSIRAHPRNPRSNLDRDEGSLHPAAPVRS